MASCTDSGRGVIELVRLLLCERDQLADGLNRQRRVHHEIEWIGRAVDDRSEVYSWIVRRIAIKVCSHVATRRVHQQGESVGRALDHLSRSQRTASAGAVLDDHRLAERRLQALSDNAGQHIARAASTE